MLPMRQRLCHDSFVIILIWFRAGPRIRRKICRNGTALVKLSYPNRSIRITIFNLKLIITFQQTRNVATMSRIPLVLPFAKMHVASNPSLFPQGFYAVVAVRHCRIPLQGSSESQTTDIWKMLTSRSWRSRRILLLYVFKCMHMVVTWYP